MTPMSGPLVVVGDALLDVDLVGRVDRIVPDAPAMVVDDVTSRARPGGAGLAARIAATQGRDVVLIAPIADDAASDELREALVGVRLVAWPWQGETAVKRRVRASGQTLMRLDSGRPGGTAGPLPDEARDVLASCSGVLASDYGRGALAHAELRETLAEAAKRVPLVWDPHLKGAPPVPGVRLATPNRSEAARLAPVSEPAEGLAAVEAEAAHLVEAWGCTAVAVTLGDRGALLSYGDQPPAVLPARPVESHDPCGAGDCFAVTAAALLADGALLPDAVAGAVASAGLFVAGGGAGDFPRLTGEKHASHVKYHVRSGTFPGSPGKVPPVLVATSGCFDVLHAGHVAMLTAARGLGDRLVVLLNSDASVRRLKGPERPLVPQDDRARVLEALSCVDEVVVFDEDTPTEAIRRLRPRLWVKGGDYAGMELPERDALAECGARTVTVPYLEGRSTTRIVELARHKEGASA